MTARESRYRTLIHRFMPVADVCEVNDTLVHAPAAVVFDVAAHFDMQSIPIIRAIFWLRGVLLGSTQREGWARDKGLVAETMAMGWGVLAHEPGRVFIAGASARPWMADVTFTPIPADRFGGLATPDVVKILWTLEADPLEPAITRFRTETRVVATDEEARTKFRRYWRIFGVGIIFIRWLLLPAIRRESERRYRAALLTARSAA